ncbi:MAG: NAD(P)-dependent alcohol dehydrogenase, partial [Anaerolineae bacterium]
MKAVIYPRPGPPDVLELVEVPTPVPKDSEMLIRVYAATVTAGDVNIRGMRFPAAFWLIMRVLYGARRPEIPVPGTELAGVVKAVGKDVRRFAEGDQVFGSTGMRFGANAEYVCMSEDGVVVRKPTNVTFEEATAVPFGALTALHFLRKGNIRRGQKVLINGASGGVGTAAVQVAKHYGADVTVVC